MDSHIKEDDKRFRQAQLIKYENNLVKLQNNSQQNIKKKQQYKQRQILQELSRYLRKITPGGNGSPTKGSEQKQLTIFKLLSINPDNHEVVKNRKTTALQLKNQRNKLQHMQWFGLLHDSAAQLMNQHNPTSDNVVDYILSNLRNVIDNIPNIATQLLSKSTLRFWQNPGKRKDRQARKMRDGPGLGQSIKY